MCGSELKKKEVDGKYTVESIFVRVLNHCELDSEISVDQTIEWKIEDYSGDPETISIHAANRITDILISEVTAKTKDKNYDTKKIEGVT